MIRRIVVLLLLAGTVFVAAPLQAVAGQVTVHIENGKGVNFVGAFFRWDQDGNLRRPVNPKAKIDAPEVDFTAARTGENTWVFKDLPRGQHDLVLMGPGRVRIEGFVFAPVLEFDPFLTAENTVEDETREWIDDHIRKSRHYENKVVPLYFAGDKQATRILVMLIRDKPTSYESHMPGAATMRFEIWQYTWRYGGWAKERRTRVFHRVILPRGELRQWTWVFDPKLGGIKAHDNPVTIHYQFPDLSKRELKGLYPY